MWWSSQSEQALVEGPREEGVQKVLMDQSQAQDTTAEPEPDPKHREHGKNRNPLRPHAIQRTTVIMKEYDEKPGIKNVLE